MPLHCLCRCTQNLAAPALQPCAPLRDKRKHGRG